MLRGGGTQLERFRKEKRRRRKGELNLKARSNKQQRVERSEQKTGMLTKSRKNREGRKV